MKKSYGALSDVSVEKSDTVTYHEKRKLKSLNNVCVHFPVYFSACVAAFNIVGMGLSAAYTSTSAVSMMNPDKSLQITNEEVTWIASIVQLSAITGGALSGFLSNILGRKAVLMYNSLPFLVSWLIVAYSSTVSWIYTGRFLTGCCCGIATVTVPTYLVEISTPNNRGRLASLFNFAIAVGAVIAMGLGMIVMWRWLAAIGAIIVTLNVILLYFIPESPHWLIANGYKTEAFQALIFLRGSRDMAVADYEAITDSLIRRQESLKRAEFFHPTLYKPIFLAITLMFFQQFSGINPLMAYTSQIFSHTGGSLNPSLASLIIAVVQVFATLLGTILIDKAGRRVNYMFSGSFTAAGLFIIGFFVICSHNDSSFNLKFGWMPVFGYILFLFAFAIGYGPIPFIMAAEMTPLHARSVVVGVATICMYLFSFVVTKTFRDFQIQLNDYGVYFLYAIISLLGVVFGWLYFPETKGKSLKEIQKYFLKQNLLKNKDLPTNINDL